MRIDVFTIFPGLVDAFATEGLLGKARERAVVDLRVHDPRDHTLQGLPEPGRRGLGRVTPGGRRGPRPRRLRRRTS